MLLRLGFEVIVAADGREALAQIREHGDRIRGIVLDLTMPRMDGEEAFRELRRIRTDIPVILSSGYSEHDVVQRFAGKGIAGFVPKPYTPANLQSVLKQALGKRAPLPGSPPA
jgi:CheY-like chemotaxis protein